MKVRLIAREKVWLFACSLVIVNAILSFALPRGHALTTIGDLSQCVLLSVVLSVFLANTKHTELRARLFWGLLSFGCVLWLLAQILWTCFEVFLGREVPNPFVGDVILFLHLVPMMAALVVRPDQERNEPRSQVGSFDFALLLMWWLYLYFFVVIPWQYVSPHEFLYGRSFDVLYLIEHFVFLLCVSAAWLQSKGPWKSVYGHLLGAASLYAASSLAASFAIDLGRYYTGSFYDIPLLAAMTWFAATALIAAKLGSSPEGAKSSAIKSKDSVQVLALLAFLSLPIMAAWTLYASDTPTSVRNFRIILTLITMMTMGILTWTKQRRLDKQLAKANQELREDSLTDLLTGAKNRRYFAGTIAADARQAIRGYSGPDGESKHNQDLVFYLIDADSFKEINDRYGHDAGDELLIQIALRIGSAIRYSDVLIRWGGDEFLVLSRYTDRNDSATLAERAINAIASEPFQLKCGASVSNTCSIGWAVFPWFVNEPEAVAYEEILRLADSALYEAKSTGRNRGIGMLPTQIRPEQVNANGKGGRLSEQLGARIVRVGAESEHPEKTAVAKTLAARTSL